MNDQVLAIDASDDEECLYLRKSPKALGLKAAWYQEAIARRPHLVMGACRQYEFTDEEWHFWTREVSLDGTGSGDLLLVSDSGRLCVVETKVAFNPEKKQMALEQILGYALRLAEMDKDALLGAIGSPLPAAVREKDVVDRLGAADYLLVIVGDQLDAGGLAVAMRWDLALVELAVYERSSPFQRGGRERLAVSSVVGAFRADVRQARKRG
jgi:hypothetical protein